MNQDQEKRLEQIFRDNQNKGIAIAITGCWGIGKTFAWNKFIKERAELEKDRKHLPLNIRLKYPNIFNKKYSYVSLFGIESLADLKVAIATNMSRNYFNEESTQSVEIPKFLKKSLSAIRDVKMSAGGGNLSLNSSARIFEAVLYSQVKDAIICLDDFERLSEKLKIQDVMGLANQLKLERNCQVILVLDESKTDSENKNKYSEYKEKLIDESIKIASVEPLIRKNTKDIDKPLVDLMVKFANELEIQNFRFFQKIIKLYKEFRAQLPEEVAYSTKEIILIRIIQGYFIEDFGVDKEFAWSDIKLVNEERQKDWSEEKIGTYRRLKTIDYAFVHDDEWLAEFIKYFNQLGEPNFSKLRELVNSDLILEESNKLRDDLYRLMEEWRNLEIDSTFCNRLYFVATKRIASENLENLSFYCDLLNEFGQSLLANELQKSIEEYLLNEYQSKGYLFVKDHFSFGFKSENRFHVFLKSLQEKQPHQGLPILRDIVYRYVFQSGWNSQTDSIVIGQATKADWHNLNFHDIPTDERFQESNKLQILMKLLDQQISLDLQPQINTLIFEILEEEAQASDVERRKNIEYVIKRLKE
ncbi:KAP family P-loop domain protein [Acinetobacter sp. NCu2D-2]|uniref:KAP family P-loop domain protein n=1 Tax=Acinetobacter sp. NCu2D-2 TaxID=1608473 RepID=UPI0007CDF513|nr:KAP family P-loop domain protein [Acinetobacter sp. NCu2D-2]ANF80794.1 KAP family P-loop domain protein [Acinetobacter sp. NCu2D-2]